MADVLVVGAGPVGLTLACETGAPRARCRIIDRLARPSVAGGSPIDHPRPSSRGQPFVLGRPAVCSIGCGGHQAGAGARRSRNSPAASA
jgi:hypothetical protein